MCASCPLVIRCPLVRCPNCSYEWPKGKHNTHEYRSLIELPVGSKKNIVFICTARSDYLQKIITMGLMPGMHIEILRKFPTFLCRIGYSEVALDDEIAKIIMVI